MLPMNLTDTSVKFRKALLSHMLHLRIEPLLPRSKKRGVHLADLEPSGEPSGPDSINSRNKLG